MSSLRLAALRVHEWLLNYAQPEAATKSGVGDDLTGRFISLFLLASLLIPFFIFQFCYTGFPLGALAMAASGCMMLSSIWIFKITGRLHVARDYFLASLLMFVVWEAFYFRSIYSPGTVWFIAMPVVSVLLGSRRAGLIWLAIASSTLMTMRVIFGTHYNAVYATEGYELLYTVSVICLATAILIFVLMVDAARARAFVSLREANLDIKKLAQTDELTGLYNRRVIKQELQSAIEAASKGQMIALVLTDLDGFKEVNDTFGHEVGDQLLCEVAKGLQALSVSADATVARLGGDEFAVLLTGRDARQRALDVAKDALTHMLQPLDIGERNIGVGISIGVAVSPTLGVDASELLRRADVAMYEAKRLGRNRVEEYSKELDSRRMARQSLSQELSIAVDNNQIEVHYQPIVDAQKRTITAVEALARWTSQDGRCVPPDEFIPIAEEAGIIDKLAMSVLRTACRDAIGWNGVKLSVNLSPVQIKNPRLFEDVIRVLSECQFPSDRLEFEVTEGYLIEHSERAQPLIDRLRNAGITVALDDFGTGYSSIAYLRHYAFDRLKIDKSLVEGLVLDQPAQGIVQAVAILARSLNLQLTAEGVETAEEAKLLQLIGCSNLQGYHFGRPQPAQEMNKKIALEAETAVKTKRVSGRSLRPR